ncbi:TPR repeat-containing protein [Hyella patelloides LEGE 07179]|uniref:TPR repeat-containing protein n=2 Tax=Hyella TaxID=945733 RepID=A0A563VJB2_9CYAN|nr:TPR repeat-containing protein [Hyella patelloides LEGE 07179]
MIYHYLFLPLAMGITLLNATSGLSLEALVKRNSQPNNPNFTYLVATQIAAEAYSKTAQAEESHYLGLMNAGYAANQKQDYLTALGYFKQALNLQPGDSQAEKAVRNISSYGFDLYMQTGYAADKIRDYTTALQNFQKARLIRPDSWYAKQAVSNVSHYLYLAQQPTTSDDDDNQSGGLNIWFLLISIVVASGLSATLLLYLFQKTESSLQEESEEESEVDGAESTKAMSLELEPVESASATAETFEDYQEPEKEQESTIMESQPLASSIKDAPPQATPSASATKGDRNAAIVPSSNSLSKLDIVPELIQDLNRSDRSMRRKAVWELAQRGDSRAMKPLVELMVEVDSQERGLILEAMTQIAGRTLKPMNKAIMMSLQDENTHVKQNAIRDLTRVYELMTQVTKRLSQAVEDSDTQVQETAKWALQKLNQMPATATWPVDSLGSEVNNLNRNNGRNSINGTGINPDRRYPLN